jgi:acyl-CoA reductase-like NAD-dependent aldehyde dehydrogenase
MHNANAACQPVTDGIAGGARRTTGEHCGAEWRVIEVSLHRTRLDDVVARARGEVGDLTR